MAEAVFHYIIDTTASPMGVCSAGVYTQQPRQTADALTSSMAQQRGYDLSKHTSQSIDMLDPHDFTHALWFDASHREPVLQWKGTENIVTVPLTDYTSHFRMPEVAMADTQWGYRIMLDQIEDACLGLWHHLKEEGKSGKI